ncbi:Mth938-like domain-containing protein [Massilia sp. 9096]|uniref:Mth938-like domain-containing protein n=1 Tax=Massilia sp. 9096 TaxID=1500894 RepID=UPI00055FD29C|nr:Mth938-like domain-containing protein [Massilia sp. 9096]
MKLHTSSTEKYQTVTGYDRSGVEINAQRFDYSVLVMPETAPRPWPVTRFEDLSAAHFEQIAVDKPDVVILGTGERQRFVHPRLIASLSGQRIGVESMDSHAACRTYNILMGEGRKVTLALIIEGKDGTDGTEGAGAA